MVWEGYQMSNYQEVASPESNFGMWNVDTSLSRRFRRTLHSDVGSEFVWSEGCDVDALA